MGDPVDKFIDDLPDALKFPGGKAPRRNYEVVKPKATAASADWDASPMMKMLKGVETEFFTIGALASAVGMKPVTIRSWEHKKRLPPSRYRLPAPSASSIEGKKPAGKRLYTRHQIEVVIEAASVSGVLDPEIKRPDWKLFTKTVVDGWKKTS